MMSGLKGLMCLWRITRALRQKRPFCVHFLFSVVSMTWSLEHPKDLSTYRSSQLIVRGRQNLM